MPTNVQSAGAPSRRLGAPKRGVKRIEKKNVGKGKAKAKKRPEWDWSSRDLSAHRLSKEELERRHQSCQSKNLELAKHELYDKAKKSSDLVNRNCNVRPSPHSSGAKRPESRRMAESRRLLTLQRALHDRELHEVLARSDESMRVVKDLFGDDPKRYSCQPNVTVAPSLKEKMTAELNSKDRVLQLSQHQRKAPGGGGAHSALDSPGGIWDESMKEMMAPRKPALNDSALLQAHSQEVGVVSHTHNLGVEKSARVADLSSIDATSEVASSDYKPQVDLHRFQQLLEEEESCSGGPSFPTNFPPGGGGGNGGGGGLMSRHRTKPPSTANNDPLGPQGNQGMVVNQHNVGLCPKDGSRQLVASEKHLDTAWCDDSVDGVREVELTSEAGSLLGPGKLSADPVDHTTVSGCQVSHHQPLGPIPRSRPLQMEGRLPGNGGGLFNSDRKKEEGEVEEEGTLISTSTSKIHADLTRLEQLVRDLDHKLEVSKKFFPRDSSPPPQQNQHTPAARTGTTSDPQTVGQANVSSLLQSVQQQLERSEKQLAGEVVLRGQFLQTLADQQDLMDTMAADLLKLQRDNMLLRRDMAEVRTSSMEEIAKLKSEVASLHSTLVLLHQQQHHSPLVVPPTSSTHLPGRLCNLKSVPPQMAKGATAQMQQSVAPPTSSIKALSRADQVTLTTVPVLAAGERGSGVTSSFSQSWVELTPRLDLDASLSRHTKKLLSLSGAGGQNSDFKASDGVVYARVSPLCYSEGDVVGKKSSKLSPSFGYAVGKGLSSVPSKSSPSRLMMPDMSTSDYFQSSSSAPDVGSAVDYTIDKQSHQPLTVGHAPAPPPISKAILPPSMQEPGASHSTPLLRTPADNCTHDVSVGVPILRSKGQDHLFLPRGKNPSVQAKIEPRDHSARPRSETGPQGVASEPSFTTTSVSVPASISDQDFMTEQTRRSAQQFVAEDGKVARPAGSTAVGFDVAGLLKSLQQLEEGSQESLVAGGPAHGREWSVKMGPAVRQQRTGVSIQSTEDPGVPLSHQSNQSLPTVSTEHLAIAVAGQKGDGKKESFKALTPISEESTLTGSIMDEEDKVPGPVSGNEIPLDGDGNQSLSEQFSTSSGAGKGSVSVTSSSGSTDKFQTLNLPQATALKASHGTDGLQSHQPSGRPVPNTTKSKIGGVASVKTTPFQTEYGAAMKPPNSVASIAPKGTTAGIRPRGNVAGKEPDNPDTWFSLSSHLVQENTT